MESEAVWSTGSEMPHHSQGFVNGVDQPPTARKRSRVQGGCLGSLLQAQVNKLSGL